MRTLQGVGDDCVVIAVGVLVLVPLWAAMSTTHSGILLTRVLSVLVWGAVIWRSHAWLPRSE